jgi:transposase
MSAHQSIPRAEWAQHYVAGTKAREIAEAAGVHPKTVWRHLRDHDIPCDQKPGRPARTIARDERVQQFIALVEAGHSVRTAGEKLGVHYNIAVSYANTATAMRPEIAEMLRKARRTDYTASIRDAAAAARAAIWPDIKEMRERGASWDECSHALGYGAKWLRKAEQENGGKPARIKPQTILPRAEMTQRQAAAVSGHITRVALHKPTKTRFCNRNDHDGMRCNAEFQSWGPGNFACPKCRAAGE